MTITAPAPIEARPRTFTVRTFALCLAIAAVGTALIVGLWEVNAPTPAPVAQVADAGPLHAHLVNGVAVCDTSSATAWTDSSQGTEGQVNMQGPGVVTVTVVGSIQRRRVRQQETSQDNIVTWDLPMTGPASSIIILARAGNSVGVCQVPGLTSPGVTRSSPLFGVVG